MWAEPQPTPATAALAQSPTAATQAPSSAPEAMILPTCNTSSKLNSGPILGSLPQPQLCTEPQWNHGQPPAEPRGYGIQHNLGLLYRRRVVASGGTESQAYLSVQGMTKLRPPLCSHWFVIDKPTPVWRQQLDAKLADHRNWTFRIPLNQLSPSDPSK